MNKKRKTVYVGMIADLLHAGHINILNEASKYGKVIVGLFTDKAAGEIDDVPYLDFSKRKRVLENITYVEEVIPQTKASYRENLEKIKPDYLLHGDDWQFSSQKKYRAEAIEILASFGSKLIEIPYSSDINELHVKERISSLGITSGARLGRLRKLINSKPIVKILEVHNALSALIVENAKTTIENGMVVSFDGMWSSSLTDSTSKGKPDIEAVDTTARLVTINEIFEVTTKPMIYDADTGGRPEHFEFIVRTLERCGVSAIIIEDKIGLKKNSLLGNDVKQNQDSIDSFSYKIKVGKKAQITKDFMIIARVESLILEKGIQDALNRAFAYIKAGADGIMIHSRKKEPDEIIEFVTNFRSKDKITPIVLVPTTFNSVKIDDFIDLGVNVIIYANHMLRAAYPNMMKVATSILKNKRSLEAEENCMSIDEILTLIPGTQ